VVTTIGSFDIIRDVGDNTTNAQASFHQVLMSNVLFHNSTNNYIRQSNGNRRMGG
jgi:hypothetical protein